jgi:hypothetical protein
MDIELFAARTEPIDAKPNAIITALRTPKAPDLVAFCAIFNSSKFSN